MNYEEMILRKEQAKEKEKKEAEKRPERAEKLISFLEKIKAFEFFKSIEKQPDSVTFGDFKSFLIQMNGILREIPMRERSFDGENVELSGGLLGELVLPPKAGDKEPLLEFAFDCAKDMDIKDDAYMIPAVINALHMFNDGNGRVSRLMHLLLISESKEIFNEQIRLALGADGRFDTPDINPGLIDAEIEDEILSRYEWKINYTKAGHREASHSTLKGGIASAEYGQITSKDETFLKNIEKYKKLAQADLYYLLTATVSVLSPEQYHSILWNESKVSPLKMETIPEHEWQRIFDFYYDLKKEHIETLVWIFRDPENYENPHNNEETLKDLFIRKIQAEVIN